MALPASHDMHIFGSINGVEFDMVGGGTGNPKDGSMNSTVKSTKGALPCSPLLIGPHLGYGMYQYLPFPDGPSPFQTDMGFEVLRTMKFEDGAVLSANYRYSYQGNKIKSEHKLVGSGFPADGPVMMNQLAAQDRSVTKLIYADDQNLLDTVHWTYITTEGKRYSVVVQTNYSWGNPTAAVFKDKMPAFVFRQIDVSGSKTEVHLVEKQKAFYDLPVF